MRHLVLALLLVMTLAPAAQAAAPRAASRTRASRAAAPTSPAATRQLDAIRIQGELDVPQVLFITAREPRRFLDLQDGRYRPSLQQLATASTPPIRIALPPAPVAHDKETHR